VQFWGQNVTNKYYWIHVVKIQDTLARITGQPTTFGITCLHSTDMRRTEHSRVDATYRSPSGPVRGERDD